MNTNEIMALATAYADERVLAVRGRSTEQDVVAADAALRTNIEALVADAERYRWLREQHWQDNKIAVVIRPKDQTLLGSMLPSEKLLDDAIDHMSGAARSKT